MSSPAQCRCGGDSNVIDSRHTDKAIRRRRKCVACGLRWTTLEVTEGSLLLEASTKRFARFKKELNELIDNFTDEGLT